MDTDLLEKSSTTKLNRVKLKLKKVNKYSRNDEFFKRVRILFN